MRRSRKSRGDNYIYAYFQRISDGSEVVGRWVRAVYELLISGLEEKRFFYDHKKATAAIEWIEGHCHHTEGTLAPGALKLELWQKAFLSAIYGIVDADGDRQFREVLLIIARKNGKSLLASAIGAYEWRMGGFGSKVFCVAPKLEQADIIYNNVWAMTQLDPEWIALKESMDERDEHNKRIHDDSMLARHRMTDLYIPGLNATFKKIAFSSKKSDGFNPSLCVCDEVAAWGGDQGLKQYEVMASAMGARPDGLLISCTTAGYISDGIYDDLMKRATRYLMGSSGETHFLPLLYMIDDPDRWNDINELRKANPNLGVSVPVKFLLGEIAKAEQSLSKMGEFMTKYCCLKQNSSTAWLTTKDVERCCGKKLELEDFRSSYAVGGIDLSQSRDLTACCCLIERGGELYVFAQFFLPRERIDETTQRDGVPYNIYVQRGLLMLSGDNFVDYHDCEDWFRRLVTEYEIYPLMTGYDRYSAQYLVQSMTAGGYRMDDVFQGENLWPVLQEMEGLIADGRVHIGDNDLLKSHLLNAAIKMSTERGRGKLVKVNPSLHIDGCAALADAFTVRQKYAAALGEQLKNEG